MGAALQSHSPMVVLGGRAPVRTLGELCPALERAFAAGSPALVNVLTDPSVAYPRRSNLA
jgi:acetolactate synthase I/II/III large subunit